MGYSALLLATMILLMVVAFWVWECLRGCL